MSTSTYQSREGEQLSHAVVRAIATASDTPQERVKPLYTSVDPDGLNNLFKGPTSGRIKFEHAGYRVTVRSTGKIQLNWKYTG